MPAAIRHLPPCPVDVRFVIVAPVSRNGDHGHAVRLPIIVGRGSEAKFRIQQDSVSRRHCELFVEDDEVYIRDLGSTNGSLVDDEEVPANTAVRVRPGAVVRVGRVQFRVEYSGATTDEPADREDDTVPLPEAASAMDEGPADDVATMVPRVTDAGDAAAEPDADEPGDGGGEAGWPAQAESAPPDDDNLNDFFKSLS